MRLDHLLSKEHRGRETGCGACTARLCGGGVLDGGDTGEFDPATAGPASTAASAVWNVGLVRLGRAAKQAPCWVLKERPGPWTPGWGLAGGGPVSGLRVVVSEPGMALRHTVHRWVGLAIGVKS